MKMTVTKIVCKYKNATGEEVMKYPQEIISH